MSNLNFTIPRTFVQDNENKLYRWDDTTIKYYCVGSDYNDIEIINGGGA